MRSTRWLHLGGLLLGCAAAPLHLYEGPRRSDAELAIIEVEEPSEVLHVDGRSVGRMESSFALLPGKHTIAFRAVRNLREFGYRAGAISRGSVEVTLSMECELRARLEAGGRYALLSWVVRVDPDPPRKDHVLSTQRFGLRVAAIDRDTRERLRGRLDCLDAERRGRRVQIYARLVAPASADRIRRAASPRPPRPRTPRSRRA